MDHTTLIIAITFGIYLCIVLVMGYLASRQTLNLSDFILGGRDLPGPIVALGAGASDMSSWLLMALPGAVFLNGLNYIWLPIGLIIGAYLNWTFVAARLRVYTEVAKNALTLPAYFGGRFPEQNKSLRASTALVVLVFFTFYTSAGFVAGAYLAQLLFHVSYTTGLLISAAVIIAYTAIGGFFAISWLDFFQGSLMFISLLIVPTVAFHHVGVWTVSLPPLAQQFAGYFDPFKAFSWIGTISLLAWGLGYFGQPHILVRFMAARSHREMPVARFICMFWMSIALFAAVVTGIVGRAYFTGSSLANPEEVFIKLAYLLFTPWLAGILISAVLCAIMNTSSAQLLSSASALIEDFYHPFFNKKASTKQLVWGARLAVLIVALTAVGLAFNPNGSILQLVAYAWSGLGASFGPVVLISLYWRNMQGNSAIIGMLGGAATVIVWEMLGHSFGGIFKLYSIIPGFIVNSLLVFIFSKIKKVKAHSSEQFEEVKKIIAG